MLAAVVVLAVLAVAQQLFNAVLLLGLRSQREGMERLAGNLSEVLEMTLELAKTAFPKEKAPAKGKGKAARKWRGNDGHRRYEECELENRKRRRN